MKESPRDKTSDAARIEKSIERGLRYLVSQQREDGGMEPSASGVLACYKVPLAFALTGELRRLTGLARWMMENLPSGDGRLRGKQSLGAFHDKFLTYTQAWITLGFLRGGFYGEAQGL
ncbi:MAG: hypothetical protein V2A58_07030, partial [Planctomycetota bacterium]